jgi:hypothetical protein
MYLDSGEVVDRAFAETFHVSDEGRAYIGRSSAAWRATGIASGADPRWSALASDRTNVAFLGEVEH